LGLILEASILDFRQASSPLIVLHRRKRRDDAALDEPLSVVLRRKRDAMTGFDPTTVVKLVAVLVLYLFLPLTALTYYFSRRNRRAAEIERIFSILKIEPGYRKVYETEGLGHYLWAVAYASVVACFGLTVLFLGPEIGFPNGEFPMVSLSGVEFPQAGSRLIFGMAFLGAYLWGFQYIFRRYALNDLLSSVYYDLSIRMILAAVIAVVIYNAYTALAGGGDSQGGITANIWPALAFLIGIFPQRGLRWLTDRLPMLAPDADPSVREMPLEMIEGIETHDILRLEELGVDTCFDLANADFVPLILKTPYSARQLIDWILQAKLCVCFGASVKDLREHGIRTIVDLEPLEPADIEALPLETSVTKVALEHAQKSVKNDTEIKRLREAGRSLGRFWEHQDEPGPQT
jgi:hypothetical protein